MSTQSILILDADESLRDSIANGLLQKGFATITASSGAEALKILRREKPLLFILDLDLPDISGEDISRILKTDPELNEIPIIVFTFKNDLKTKLNYLELGVEEYLLKPMETEELVARISRFIKLMKQWKTAPSAFRAASSRRHTDTTADLANKTLATVHVPSGEHAKPKPLAVVEQPVATAKTDKTSYGVYRIESIAGTGGMGLVYKAHDPMLDRYVAVKVLSKEWSSSAEFAARFRSEAKLIAAINHPGIAQIFTFAEEQGESYFALQWCPGGSLANLIRSQGKIQLLPAIDIIMQCARALEVASVKGVVHRDIKPSNLMFDENQQIKIVDFGIASSEKMPLKTDRSTVIGSPAYMSPEQGRAGSTDHRTDIYSLGITFYQMLYGQLPFTAESPQKFVEKHTKAPFPAYDDLNGKVPPRAYKVIEKMTQKNANTRYQTYSELIKDLERVRQELYSQRRLKIPTLIDVDAGPKFRRSHFFDLLAGVFQSEKSGLMKVSWGSLQKKFLIARNEIVHFESPQQDESCWALLVNRKLMKKEDHPSEHEDLEESLNRLLSLKAFSPEDFKTVWRELMMQSVMQVFLWPAFEGEFYEGKIEHDPLARIPLSKVLMTAARSMIAKEVIHDSIRADHFIVRTPKFEDRLRLLNLSTDENFLASRVEGENITLETLQLLTGFTEEQVSRTLYALEKAGVVKYEALGERRPRRANQRVVPESVANPGPEPIFVEEQKAHIGKVEELRTDNPKPERKWNDVAPQPDALLGAKQYDQAEAKMKVGQYSEAARLCAQAIQNSPSQSKYHFLMARILSHFPHSMKATIEAFRHAVQLDQDNVEYRLHFVEFLKISGQFEVAFHECEKLLAMAPNDRKISLLLRQIELEK